VSGAESRGAGTLSRGARLLLWDYDRGSWPYDMLCLLLLLILFATPPGWWSDPMWVRP
jgi:hypothetical protein